MVQTRRARRRSCSNKPALLSKTGTASSPSNEFGFNRNDKGRLSAPSSQTGWLVIAASCLALRWLVAQDPQSLTSPFRERGQYARKLLARNQWQSAAGLSQNSVQSKRTAHRCFYRVKLFAGEFCDFVSSFSMAIFTFDSIEPAQAHRRHNVAFRPTDRTRSLKMAVELQMMVQNRLWSGSTQRNHRHQQFVGSVPANHNNGPDLDDFRYFIASKITNQHTALLGLIKKCHPYHSLEKKRFCAIFQTITKADALPDM